jgi:NADH:ubiquinone oxidoreductase subunit E
MNTISSDNENLNELKLALEKHFPREHNQLMPALHYAHHQYNYLPEPAIEVVARHVKIPLSEAYGAVTSYSEMRLVKPKEHLIKVCTGLSCKIANSDDLLNIARQFANKLNNVDVEETACGFLCSVAPAVCIDGAWAGKLDPINFKTALNNLTQRIHQS